MPNVAVSGSPAYYYRIPPARESEYLDLIQKVLSGKEDLTSNLTFLISGFKKLFHYSNQDLKKSYQIFFQNATLDVLDKFLNGLVTTGLKDKNLGLHEFALKFCSYEKLEQMLRFKDKESEDPYKTIEGLASKVSKYFKEPVNSKIKPSLFMEIKRGFSFILNFIPNVINTFLIAFSLYDIGKDPQSAWEASAMLDIYYKFIMIPAAIVVVLSLIIPIVGIKLYAIGAGVVLLCSVLLFIYVKWLRPCPSRLPYCTNLTEEAKLGRIPTVVGREKEINKIVNYFRHFNHSKQLLLVGATGVGKTEIVRGLAQKIAQKDPSLPDSLKNKKIFVLNTARLVQGGQWGYADQLDFLLNRVKGYEGEVIFFFEEIHAALKNNSSLSDFLKPILDRGNIQCIASTTDEEYRKYILKEDLAFKRRFEVMSVKSMHGHDTKEALETIIEQSPESYYVEQGVYDALIQKTNQIRDQSLKNGDNTLQQPAFAAEVLIAAMNKISASLHSCEMPEKFLKRRDQLKELKERMSSNPDCYPTTDQGKILLKKIEKKERKLAKEQESLAKKRKKIDLFNKLATDLKSYKREIKGDAERGIKQKTNKRVLIEFYWIYAYVIPQLNESLKKLKSEIHDGFTKVAIDETLIDEVLAEIKENQKQVS